MNKTVILRVEGDGDDLHYMYGPDGKEPERGVLRGGGEHRLFVIEGNALLTIGTAASVDTLPEADPAFAEVEDENAEAEHKDGDGTFDDGNIDPKPQAAT